jgi:hypothetical protein
MTTGIYQILNIENGKSYIGKTGNFLNREEQHFYQIRKKKHSNKKLQLDINNKFVFNILKECEHKYTDYYEWYYMKMYNSIENGYNIAKSVNFENFDLLQYEESIIKIKDLLNYKYYNEEVRLPKLNLKDDYNISNFRAFVNLIQKEDLKYHSCYVIEETIYFDLISLHLKKLYEALNY